MYRLVPKHVYDWRGRIRNSDRGSFVACAFRVGFSLLWGLVSGLGRGVSGFGFHGGVAWDDWVVDSETGSVVVRVMGCGWEIMG